MKKKVQLITVFVFCSFLGVLTILNFMNPDKEFSENENRYLKQFPEFSIKKLLKNSYTSELDTYLNDQFIFRDNWIGIKAFSKIGTGSIENNGVYIGKNKTLIQMFSSYDENTLNKSISQINKFVENLDIPAQLMIVPTASDIDQDLLPMFSFNINQENILAVIESQVKGDWINVSDTLANQKDVYFKTDHHWNSHGAYLAYKAYCLQNKLNEEQFDFEKVTDDFKGTLLSKAGVFWYPGDAMYKMIPQKPIKSEVIFEDGTSMDSLFDSQKLVEKDKYAYYLGGNHSLVTIKNKGVVNDQGKILVVKDSYAHIFIPYLASHYSEIIMVDLRYYRLPLTELIASEDINQVLFLYNLENFVTEKNFAFLR